MQQVTDLFEEIIDLFPVLIPLIDFLRAQVNPIYPLQLWVFAPDTKHKPNVTFYAFLFDDDCFGSRRNMEIP